MGGEESGVRSNQMKMYDSFSYIPMTSNRTEAAYSDRKLADHLQQPNFNQPGALLRTAYHGVWSMSFPNGVSPTPRLGQCYCYDSENDQMIIAYGCDSDGNCLDDVWALDFPSFKWKCICRHALSPRKGCTSILIGRKMYVYGGLCDRVFFGDLHTICIDDGSVDIISCGGDFPSPRTGSVLFSTHNSMFLWSGFDGNLQNDIHQLTFDNLLWSRFDSNYSGRPAPAFCTHKGEHFVFGSAKSNGLLKFDPVNLSLDQIECSGTEPSPELSHAALVSADEFMFLVGGETNSEHMHIFACEVKRKWWFAFHIRPDGESLVLADGIVNKIGLFMLPREFSAAVVYKEKTRELISSMGSRMINPPPIFKISIGQALGLMHIRSDMLEIFNSDGGFLPLKK